MFISRSDILIQIAVFWVMTPCSMIENYKYFDGNSVLQFQVIIWNIIIHICVRKYIDYMKFAD
jgi:hypothetical protein